MRIVLGIDPAGRYLPALRLIGRLQFRLEKLVLAASLESAPTEPGTKGSGDADERATVESALAQAQTAASELGLITTTEMLNGPAAAALIECAERSNAEVLAVQSERKSPFRAFFFGSVSRGLTIGAPQSVLFSKDHEAPTGPVHAVFATDHSPYALRSVEHFLSMGARGIDSIHIVSAVCMQDYAFWATHFDPYRSTDSRERSLQKEFETRNEVLASKFRAAGYEVTHEAPIASANESIAQAMEQRHAELLIISAQGHGFVERMLIGSVSMHQVMIEPHSVLLIRPPKFA